MRPTALSVVLLLTSLLLPQRAPGAARQVPVAVSPGSSSELALIENRCPTFSWGSVAGARSYELVIYRLGDEGDEAEEVLRQSFAASIASWTPSLDHCLERGGQYAWAIRAITQEGGSVWSPASLFAVTGLPGDAEFHEAVALVWRRLSAESGVADTVAAADSQPAEDGDGLTPPGMPSLHEVPVASPASIGTAVLTVEGEVRTVRSDGEARLWGRGRPAVTRYGTAAGPCDHPIKSIEYGLSYHIVPWHAADHACPAGTWVCVTDDLPTFPCNTNRPDGSADARDCDHNTTIDWLETEHRGWLANGSSGNPFHGSIKGEHGVSGSTGTCRRLPVWCCSEAGS